MEDDEDVFKELIPIFAKHIADDPEWAAAYAQSLIAKSIDTWLQALVPWVSLARQRPHNTSGSHCPDRQAEWVREMSRDVHSRLAKLTETAGLIQ